MTVKNRLVMSPMCQYSAVDGTVNDWHVVHLGSRAMGGTGLVITEMTDVSPEGRISNGCAGMYKPEHIEAWKRVVDFVHSHSDAKIAISLPMLAERRAARLHGKAGARCLTTRPGKSSRRHPYRSRQTARHRAR